MNNSISYTQLFLTFLKINALTFGGGYTIVPVIRDEFTHNKKLIDEEEMLNIVTLAQSGPGAMAISTSLLTGYRVKGFKGAIVSLIASVLPPLIIITIVFFFYDTFKSNFWVKSALEGMAGIISAALFITVYQMAKQAIQKNTIFSILLMIGSFIASFLFKIHTVLIIVTLAIIGLVVFSIFDDLEVK